MGLRDWEQFDDYVRIASRVTGQPYEVLEGHDPMLERLYRAFQDSHLDRGAFCKRVAYIGYRLIQEEPLPYTGCNFEVAYLYMQDLVEREGAQWNVPSSVDEQFRHVREKQTSLEDFTEFICSGVRSGGTAGARPFLPKALEGVPLEPEDLPDDPSTTPEEEGGEGGAHPPDDDPSK